VAPKPIKRELVCAECGQIAEAEARGWRAHLVWADEGPPRDELVLLCPDCAQRERLA
jgi:hypothetical protein